MNPNLHSARLRGLHYQKGDYCHAKLVRVIKGEVYGCSC